jgi:glutathione peroxidase
LIQVENLPESHLDNNMDTTSFYDFEAAQLNGETISLDQFKDKTIVVVNTASKCGLTPQYEGLEKLYQKYKDEGLVILGFPCNQFANQEKGTSEEIQEFCQVNYGVSFPMFEKIEVNGKNAHPIFKYLKSKLSGGLLGSRIKWNFTKFLIDKNGTPVKRFAPTTVPEKMEKDIEKIL